MSERIRDNLEPLDVDVNMAGLNLLLEAKMHVCNGKRKGIPWPAAPRQAPSVYRGRTMMLENPAPAAPPHLHPCMLPSPAEGRHHSLS